MRTSLILPLAVVAACVWAASLGAAPGVDPLDEQILGAASGACDMDAETADRIGGFYTNFWPDGEVPYEFVTGSTDSIPVNGNSGWTRVLSDVTFSIPFSGPQLDSPTGFPLTWQLFDIVRCTGSTRNDNRDMKIVGRTLNAAQTAFTTIQVELPIGFGFSAESPSPNVKFFVTRSVSEENMARFEQAAARWEAVANVNLRPKQSGDNDYIEVTNFNRNYVNGDVGHGSGARTLTMNRWDLQRTITHEIGHSLGAKHEHQRPDRATYVNVNTTIIQAGSGGNFTPDNSITIYPNLFYDYGSIMHYSQNAFLAAGQTGPVIQIIDPTAAGIWQTQMGRVDSLSYWDKTTMSFMYPESNWRFLREDTPATTNDGGFLTPFDDFPTAYSSTPTSGRLFITHPDDYIAPGVYSKAMTIKAPQGGVTIRAN